MKLLIWNIEVAFFRINILGLVRNNIDSGDSIDRKSARPALLHLVADDKRFDVLESSAVHAKSIETFKAFASRLDFAYGMRLAVQRSLLLIIV